MGLLWVETLTKLIADTLHYAVHNVSYCSNGVSALHCAVSNGHPDVVQHLLESGININAAVSRNERSALIMASEQNDAKITELLVAAGAKLNLTDIYGMIMGYTLV